MNTDATAADRNLIAPYLRARRIGYFSMEIALHSRIPTYSGGLGVLAGDTLRSAADLGIPMVGVTLVSRQGYFRQTIDAAGRQHESADPWDPADTVQRLPAKVAVRIEQRDVWISGWLYRVDGIGGVRQPVVLLDTNLPENDERDRNITDHLYGGDECYRLKQEIVLGIGGVRMLEALGFRVEVYHLNEGHSALLTLQLLARHAYSDTESRPGEPRHDLHAVRELCHFTTHTPVEAGHDRFAYPLVERVLGEFVDLDLLRRFAGDDALNTTRLALNLSGYVNGVAKRHAQTSSEMFPGFSFAAITNGVHPATWVSADLALLYDRCLPGWRIEPELLMRADCCLAADAVWACHESARSRLFERIRQATGVQLDPALPTIGYARRMTQYKRPALLFSSLDRLRAIAAQQPFQVVLAGKAHPRDETGKQAIEALHAAMTELSDAITVAYLPNYDMDAALAMVSGVDVWLNTPQPPLEASGTSGMKAAMNGVPNLSVLDGWWVEGHIEGITGWAIGNGTSTDAGGDAQALYRKLEQVVLPLYRDRGAWITVMKGAISRNASVFHSHRMMRRYTAEAYLR